MSSTADSSARAHTSETTLSVSEQAFYRDLPKLLKSDQRRWVAYCGGDFVDSDTKQTALYERCLNQGLRPTEFVVLFVDEAARYDHEDIDLPASF